MSLKFFQEIFRDSLGDLINFANLIIFILYNRIKIENMGKRQYRELDDLVKQKISQSMKGRSKTTSHKEHISNGLKQYWKQVPNKPFCKEVK